MGTAIVLSTRSSSLLAFNSFLATRVLSCRLPINTHFYILFLLVQHHRQRRNDKGCLNAVVLRASAISAKEVNLTAWKKMPDP